MNKKVLIWNLLLVLLVVISVKNSSAQQKQLKEEQLEITIINGDTTVNGKNFKDITEEEKVTLRKKFETTEGQHHKLSIGMAQINKRVCMIKKDDGDTISLDSGKNHFYSFDKDRKPVNFEIRIDSMRKNMGFFSEDSNKELREDFAKRFGDGTDMDWKMVHPKRSAIDNMPLVQIKVNNARAIRFPNIPNSSHFDYTITDKDGFTTEQHVMVIDAGKLDFINIFKGESAINFLKIKNLVLYPNFSNGKTTITFQAPAKASLKISLLDNQGEVLFSEKKTLAADAYSKDFPLNKNGIYFLEVKQGSKSFIKKIIKN